MKFGEIIETVDKPVKLITPLTGHVGYYRGHTNTIIWLSMKPTSKRLYPYPLLYRSQIPIEYKLPFDDINTWEVTLKEECNIEELFTFKKSKL
jgi:hypothetical protein